MLCTAACVAIDVQEDTHLLRTKQLPTSISKCKRNCYAAYQLCVDKLGKSKAVRDECVRSYLITFPKCYFMTKESSCSEVSKSYSKCVMESLDYSETFACFNAMSAVQARIKSTVSDDITLEKRSNVQDCNGCRNSRQLCFLIAANRDVYKQCRTVGKQCLKQYGCR